MQAGMPLVRLLSCRPPTDLAIGHSTAEVKVVSRAQLGPQVGIKLALDTGIGGGRGGGGSAAVGMQALTRRRTARVKWGTGQTRRCNKGVGMCRAPSPLLLPSTMTPCRQATGSQVAMQARGGTGAKRSPSSRSSSCCHPGMPQCCSPAVVFLAVQLSAAAQLAVKVFLILWLRGKAAAGICVRLVRSAAE